MKKTLDYEKLDRMKEKISEITDNIEFPDVEDAPVLVPDPPEGFDDLTDEEYRYVAFGIKPE
ncbi:hypothetical protein B5C00_10040 [Staphylococcus delphini]|uniref:hypothetical protein n=1 Tax=Staphylococcus delphini TaxID=53344 RepID=UPI000BBC36D9|nr:hypothetical protein [Staphylococcus delphini]MDE9800079.1 hypothetical protein [Staphylococcus delphini]MDE9806946.1 hypothetical protein [Staphylococcus delphini]PCF32778.1 hypothetical protein B5C00_10040 [Staphylococcus delphini]